jgi:hypothetical protein
MSEIHFLFGDGDHLIRATRRSHVGTTQPFTNMTATIDEIHRLTTTLHTRQNLLSARLLLCLDYF